MMRKMDTTTLTLGGAAIIATSKGLNKLAESLPMAISKFYEPIHQVRMAKAKKKSLSIISEAMRENIDMPIKMGKLKFFQLILKVF